MQSLQQRYLEQLKHGIMNALNRDVPASVVSPASLEAQLQPAWFAHFWFGDALTMSSRKRLDNIQFCIEDCLARRVPGDIAECGA